MPEHSPFAPPEEEIRLALSGARDWGERHAQPLGARAAVRRARRRVAVRVGGVAVAVVAVGVVLQLRTTSVALHPAPVPPAGSASPSTSSTPSGVPSPTAAVPLPAISGIDLAADAGTDGDTVVTRDAAMDFPLCSDAALPGPVGTVDMLRVHIDRPEWYVQRALYVFATADEAVAFATAIAAEAESCPDRTDPDGTRHRVLTQPIAGPWGSGVAVLRVDESSSPSASPPIGSWLLLGRRGSAVAVHTQRTEYFLFSTDLTAIDPAALAAVRTPLDALAAKLCPWTAAGCP